MNNMKKKTKKILILTISVILGVVLIFGGTFLCLFASTEPDMKVSELTDKDYFVGAKVAQSILSRTLKSKNPNEKKTLRLKNDELQTLLRLAENGDSLLYLISGKQPQKKVSQSEQYKITYDRGVYNFTVKLTETCCGLCFTATGAVTFEYEDGEIDVDFLSLKVGRVEMPDSVKEKLEKRICDEAVKEAAFDIIREGVSKIEYHDDGSAVITYYPYRLRKYFIGGLF